MTSLIDRIELLIKREKTTPERKKKDDSNKSSNEILSELFSAFNADPPKIEDISKKPKKSKKKHKEEKKKKKKRKRSNSRSNESNSDVSDHSHKRKKRKKTKKHKDRKSRDRSRSTSRSKKKIKVDPDIVSIKKETVKIKTETVKVKSEPKIKVESKQQTSSKDDNVIIDLIPMPDSPPKIDSEDLRHKIDKRQGEAIDCDKGKGKIQIKNLKFSAVFEETVKQAEEEKRKRAEKYEDGEVSDSTSQSEGEEKSNLNFPKSSDPGGILKKQANDEKLSDLSKKISHSESKSSHKERDRSKPKRSHSRSRRSRSRSSSRRHRHRSSSRSRRRSHSRSRRRSRSRSRHRTRHSPTLHRRRSRSPTGVKLADSEKKRLLEVARRNAINMLKNGAVPAGAAALPPHTRSQVMAAIQSGGKSVDELTDFCKHLSKKEALGELSSDSSNCGDDEENEDTMAFHHPFLVKEKAPIVMNIRGGAPLPIKSNLPVQSKEELRIQFPVSSGTQHRENAIEWRPVIPTDNDNNNMQVAKLDSKSLSKIPASTKEVVPKSSPNAPLALPAPPVTKSAPVVKGFTSGDHLSSVPALTAPGPQAYPPSKKPPAAVVDMASIVTAKLSMIRRAKEESDLSYNHGFGWSAKSPSSLGQFTGSTGAQILTPRELASGTQAWAKKDQLTRAAPVKGGLGMHLLQKMGWVPGRGLGKEGTGALQPLLLEVKLDTKGLQAKEENNRNRIRQTQRRIGTTPAPLVPSGKHPVSLLGEYCSKHKVGPPEYELCFECGPDHKKNFLFKVKVARVEYKPAVASANKKQAKADAATLALQKLGILP